jgi:hypothetical protein
MVEGSFARFRASVSRFPDAVVEVTTARGGPTSVTAALAVSFSACDGGTTRLTVAVMTTSGLAEPADAIDTFVAEFST